MLITVLSKILILYLHQKMQHEKLIELRKAKKITQSQMAKNIHMEQTTYSRKERGKSPISEDEWNRLANVLNVEVEQIKDLNNSYSIKNDHWSPNNNSISIQYVNIPKNVFDIIIKYNSKLEEENQNLKNKVERLR